MATRNSPAGTLVGVDGRNVVLESGDVGWVFPNLTDETEIDAVREGLTTADAMVYGVGQVLGAPVDAAINGIPMNRLYYQRLGPAPALPVTILVAEGGSGGIEVFVLCAPGDGAAPALRPSPYSRPGPPWLVEAWVSVSCDSDPRSCAGHPVSSRSGQLRASPIATVLDIQTAAAWLLELVTRETEASLRARDSRRGHAAVMQRRG